MRPSSIAIISISSSTTVGNPLSVNGLSIGDGHEALLAQGDELALGDYRIAVEIAEPTQQVITLPAAANSWDDDSAPAFEALTTATTDMPPANLGYDPFDPDEILPRPGALPRSQPRAPIGATMRNDTPGYAEPLPKKEETVAPIYYLQSVLVCQLQWKNICPSFYLGYRFDLHYDTAKM